MQENNNLAEDLDICLRPNPMFTSGHNSKELWMILHIYFADSQLQKCSLLLCLPFPFSIAISKIYEKLLSFVTKYIEID